MSKFNRFNPGLACEVERAELVECIYCGVQFVTTEYNCICMCPKCKEQEDQGD